MRMNRLHTAARMAFPDQDVIIERRNGVWFVQNSAGAKLEFAEGPKRLRDALALRVKTQMIESIEGAKK